MRTLKAKEFTPEAFRPYGQFYDLLNPQGPHLGSFYHDKVMIPVAGPMPFAFSSLVVDRPQRLIVTADEYHDETAEISLCLDCDTVIHVTSPSKDPHPEDMEAFVVPKGTIIAINPGVWHMCSFPVDADRAHILIGLPERTYVRDCKVVEYAPEDQVELTVLR